MLTTFSGFVKTSGTVQLDVTVFLFTFIIHSPSCHSKPVLLSFFLQNIKEDILKNVFVHCYFVIFSMFSLFPCVF